MAQHAWQTPEDKTCTHHSSTACSMLPSVSTANTNRIRKKSMPVAQTPDHSSPSRHSTCLDPMSFPWLHNTRIISQEAINHLLMDDLCHDMHIFTPFKLMPPRAAAINFEHFAMPIICPTTCETITRQKTHEQSSHSRNLDDGAWQRFWKNEPRQ
jgi:hypothetical protein